LAIVVGIISIGHPARGDSQLFSDLLARAGTYVLQLQSDLAIVISDEDYEQHAQAGPAGSPTERTMKSEMLFTWLPDERAWLSVRNVLSVDGHPITDSSERLEQLMKGTAPVGIARLRRLRNEGARFNLGSIGRNFNDPMLPLRFVEPVFRPRFKFSAAGAERIAGEVATKVAYDEKGRPTVIQDNGRDRPSHGALWIRSDGVVARTRLEVGGRDGPNSMILGAVTIDYARDAKLEMIVPMRMHELYTQLPTAGQSIGPLGAHAERIECVARYSNFRRFETSARIVPDGPQ
jgi:hypothetical protein